VAGPLYRGAAAVAAPRGRYIALDLPDRLGHRLL